MGFYMNCCLELGAIPVRYKCGYTSRLLCVRVGVKGWGKNSMVQEMGFIYNQNKQNKPKLPRRGKTGQLARQHKTGNIWRRTGTGLLLVFLLRFGKPTKKVHYRHLLIWSVHRYNFFNFYKKPRFYLWFLCFSGIYMIFHILLIALTRFLTILLKKYYQLSTFLILALIETSPFQMQNTQKEYASLFLTVHICHTFQFMLTYFIKTMIVCPILSLEIMTSFFLFPYLFLSFPTYFWIWKRCLPLDSLFHNFCHFLFTSTDITSWI